MIKTLLNAVLMYISYVFMQYYFTNGYVIALLPTLFIIHWYMKYEKDKIKGIEFIRYLILYFIGLFSMKFLPHNTVVSQTESINGYLIISAVIIAPLWEEWIFRKYLYHELIPYIGEIGAGILSISLFILIHTPSNVIDIIRYLIPSILLLYGYRKFNYNLKVPVITHMLNNLLSLI